MTAFLVECHVLDGLDTLDPDVHAAAIVSLPEVFF